MDNKKQEKDNFLAIISCMDKDQLNDLIKEKGKQPKLIQPIFKTSEYNK